MTVNHIKISHAIMAIIGLLVLSEPGCFYLTNTDNHIFLTLNSTLGISEFWDRIWMILNHKIERIAIVLLIITITFSSILFAKDHSESRILLANSITVILFIGIFMAINFILFSRIFPIEKLSPSLVFDEFISLQEMFNSTDVKVSSTHSFPGDHAFVATSWALLTWKFAPKKLRYIIVPVWLIMSTARLFAGAHWFTDVAFGVCFAYFLFSYAALHKVWYFVERKILSLIKKLDPVKAK